MIVFPNAKINLGLRITSRRPDGYHTIESLMVPIPWHDILEAVPSPSGSYSLTVTGRGVDCPPEKNLVTKALRALETKIGCELPPLALFLRKIIPDGAGMGGGSADTAYALTLFNALLSLGLNDDALAGVASEVGADCPFFIYNNVAAVSGIGTVIQATPEAEESLRSFDPIIVMAKPPESVSTKEAYAAITPRPIRGLLPAEIVASLPPEEWEEAGLVNDFEPGIMARCPSVREAKVKMKELGAVYAAMTGSGSAVFGLFERDSDILSAPLSQIFTGCDIKGARLFQPGS